MEARPLVKVSIPPPADRRYRSWGRLIEGVDRKKRDGYAFLGPWVRRGRLEELPAGALVLLYDQVGSRRHHEPRVRVMRVQADSSLVPVQDDQGPLEAEGWDWALLLRDRVAAVLGEGEERPLQGAETGELARELARREEGADAYLSHLLGLLASGSPLALRAARQLLAAAPDLARAAEACARRLACQEGEDAGGDDPAGEGATCP